MVIATPLELSNVRFEGIELPHIPPRKYQSTISTFVRGRLSASYFRQQTAPKGDAFISMTEFASRTGCQKSPVCQTSDVYAKVYVVQYIGALLGMGVIPDLGKICVLGPKP